MLSRDRASAVQRAILLEYLKSGNTLARLFDLGVALIFWPWKSLAQAWRLTRQVGTQVAEVRSRSVQFLQQIYLAWFHGISPAMYYIMGVVASRSRIQPMEWLQDGHAGLLSRVFRNEKTLPEINDKLLFARTMEQNGVPTPPLLAVFDEGQPIAGVTGQEFVREAERYEALFVKPVWSSGGKDSILAERAPSGGWRCKNSSRSALGFHRATDQPVRRECSSTELLDALLELSRLRSLMVQARLLNHSKLEQFGCSGLLSLRVLSGFRSGTVSPIGAVLSIPYLGSINSQDGYKAAVNLIDGRLGRIFQISTDQRFSPTLPGTNVPVEGVILPCWVEVLNLVESAHKALPDYAFLGWDVAICPDGPLMLEANGNFGASGLQKTGPSPLIDEKFLAIFDYWQGRGRAGRSTAEGMKG